MEAAHARIQSDLLFLVWLILAIGLAAHAIMRRIDPRIRWQEHGNVSTQAFGLADLVLVILGFLGTKLLILWGEARLPDVPEQRDHTTFTLITGGLFQITILSFLIAWFLFRGIKVLDLFGFRRMSKPAIIIFGIVTSVVIVPLVMALAHMVILTLSNYLGKLPPQPLVDAFQANGSFGFRFVTFIMVVFVAPIFEEIIFRGYLYGVLKRYSDRYFAAILASAIFALSHEGVISLVPIFALALFLVISYETFGSLWIPMIIHSAFNLATFFLMLRSPN